MKFNELGRSFFRKTVQMCSNFATTCTRKGTQGAKLPIDATFSGRSMVEMLGVLAIIGVLSVGAIAGYSKAMMKYKLNKQTEQISLVFNTLIKILYELNIAPCSQNAECSYTKTLWSLNELPEDMRADTPANNIQDALDFKYFVYMPANKSDQIATRIWMYSKGSAQYPSSYNKESCINLLQTAKSFYNNLYDIMFFVSGAPAWYLKGAKSNSNYTPITSLTVAELEQKCAVCSSQSEYCYMNVVFQ